MGIHNCYWLVLSLWSAWFISSTTNPTRGRTSTDQPLKVSSTVHKSSASSGLSFNRLDFRRASQMLHAPRKNCCCRSLSSAVGGGWYLCMVIKHRRRVESISHMNLACRIPHIATAVPILSHSIPGKPKSSTWTLAKKESICSWVNSYFRKACP